jgi:7-cyano-7-deazaguanine synthase
MCFILGVFSPKKVVNFSQLLSTAEQMLLIRGRDAVGAYYHLAGRGGTEYALLSGDDRRIQLSRFLSKLPKEGHCMMLQTRAKPETEEAGISCTQPLDRAGWVVSFNGTIANDRELRGKMDDVNWENEPPVDSIVLPYLFSRKPLHIALKEEVEGSFAIAAHTKADSYMYLAKNFQPLYYKFWGDRLYYSSLRTTLATEEFPPYKLLRWHGFGTWYDLYRKPPEKSVLVLFSSGLDSTLVLRLYQVLGFKVGALFFSYGQQAGEVEAYCSKKICELLHIPYYCITLPMGQFSSPLLAGNKPELDSLRDAESTFSYIPQRNLIMSSFALALAEQIGYGGVALGIDLSESSYPDNCVPFLKKLGEITPYSSNWQTRLRVTSPLINLMKSEMLEVGQQIGVPFEHVCSCYYPKLSSDGRPIYCNDCGSDVLYRNAWSKLGYRPPNLGFESLEGKLETPVLSKVDPNLRLDLEEIPYWYTIKETL